MTTHLVIVESPAKSRTIKKYLGKDYEVLASYGHVRDLIPKEGAVDTDNNFEMQYQLIERNEKHVASIIKSLKKADSLLLATDPDREGEAISWHLIEHLKEQGLLDGKDVQRVIFHEITKKAVKDAIDNPRKLSTDLVNAQQARRALDYLVGFNLSPLLWKKINRGLSAGRVQSPALRMIAEREDEIEKFVSREYWSVQAQSEKDQQNFTARLTQLHGEKVEQFTITNTKAAEQAKSELLAASGNQLVVLNVTKKERKRNPSPPFTTSTMQQEAVRKLGFSAQRTMRLAQQLYEGVKTAEESIGLISYMRTDSVTLSAEALADARDLISKRFGAENVPEQVRTFKNKSKNAQEAHEAIRPTSAHRTPEEMSAYLTPDQLKLYDLIWKRTIASQMIHATVDTVAIDFSCGENNKFRANGSTIRNPGFLAVYEEGTDESDKKEDSKTLPPMESGDVVPLKEIVLEQHFTEPPPRYSEASLVKSLEEHGIGRPSTYASIISTLQSRNYVEMEQRRFHPTDMGRVVNTFLSNHFTQYVDYDFTARMEDDLDAVSRGEKDWVPLMSEFWTNFKKLVDDKEVSVTRDEAVQSRELGTDPESGRPVSVRIGRYGPYVQIGTKDDEDKPRFAGLRPGQKMNTIEFDEAMFLFNLPRNLGETAEGEPVQANIGRFGPYIRYGSKFVSIKEDDPYTIELPRALELVAEKKEADANRIIQNFEDDGIQVLNGRYGPYITDGNKNAKIPKDKEPKELTLDECKALIEAAPEKRGRGKKATAKVAPAKTTKAKKKTASKKKAASKKKVSRKKTSSKKTVAKKSSAKKTASKKKSTAKKKASAKSATTH